MMGISGLARQLNTVDLVLFESPFLKSRYSSNTFYTEFLELSSNIYSYYSNLISELKCQFYKENRRITQKWSPLLLLIPFKRSLILLIKKYIK